jgi:hypothetical protein
VKSIGWKKVERERNMKRVPGGRMRRDQRVKDKTENAMILQRGAAKVTPRPRIHVRTPYITSTQRRLDATEHVLVITLAVAAHCFAPLLFLLLHQQHVTSTVSSPTSAVTACECHLVALTPCLTLLFSP